MKKGNLLFFSKLNHRNKFMQVTYGFCCSLKQQVDLKIKSFANICLRENVI